MRMDIVVADCGSSDPFDIIEYLGATYVPLYSTLIGYVRRVKGYNWVGINELLPEKRILLAGRHEVAHLIGHLDNSEFGNHQESALFTTKQGLYDKTLSYQEKEANLVAADFTIPTHEFLELIGYYDTTIRELVAKQAELDEAVKNYDQLRSIYSYMTISDSQKKRLAAYYKKVQQLRADVQEIQCDVSGYCRTVSEIARELDFDEDFIVYKAEALRTRGYDLPPLELQSYDKMLRW